MTAGCPCMIPADQQTCVAPGSDLVLRCDPGGECVDHCSWETPQGDCSWADGSLHCQDPSLTPSLSGGNCNLQISNADYRHSGRWKCKVVPSSLALSGRERETFRLWRRIFVQIMSTSPSHPTVPPWATTGGRLAGRPGSSGPA